MQHLLVTSFLPSPPDFILVHTLMFPMQPKVINEGLDCALLAEDETGATSCKASSRTWGSVLEGANPLQVWPGDLYHVGHTGQGAGMELA